MQQACLNISRGAGNQLIGSSGHISTLCGVLQLLRRVVPEQARFTKPELSDHDETLGLAFVMHSKQAPQLVHGFSWLHRPDTRGPNFENASSKLVRGHSSNAMYQMFWTRNFPHRIRIWNVCNQICDALFSSNLSVIAAVLWFFHSLLCRSKAQMSYPFLHIIILLFKGGWHLHRPPTQFSS